MTKNLRKQSSHLCLAIGHDASIKTFQGAQYNVLDITEEVSLGVASTIRPSMHLVKYEFLGAATLQKVMPCIRPGACLLIAHPADCQRFGCMLCMSKILGDFATT